MDTQRLILTDAQASALTVGFRETFGSEPVRFFSAPGRTELGGNHTDHQRGRVLAAAVNLDTVAAVRENGTDLIRIQSKGYPICVVDLNCLNPDSREYNTTVALIRGLASRFQELGCELRGFDAYVESSVLPGSGLSSSAAYEVLLGTVINSLFFDDRLTPAEIAAVGQYAENVFFGKPCGLMDQMASAVGNVLAIDFSVPDKPLIRAVNFDFASCGHALCIIDTMASHADLTDEYAAITGELRELCACFGKEVLTQIPEEDFIAAIPALRERCGDRAVLRAYHFYRENQRVTLQAQALERGDFKDFLRLVRESGCSSYMYLQNVIPSGYKSQQAVAVALAACEHFLKGEGACRVHGGGFAGTVQAFVPMHMLDTFREGIDKILGQGACHVLTIRPQGGVEAFLE